MHLKLVVKLVLISMLLLNTLAVSTLAASYGQPNLQEGDYWEYYKEIRLYDTETETEEVYVGMARIEVGSDSTLEYKGTSYEVFELYEITVIAGNETEDSENTTSWQQGITKYLQKNDYSLVKESFSIVIDNVIDTYEYYYFLPIKEFDYPISEGKTWNLTAVVEDPSDGSTMPFSATCECIDREAFVAEEVNGEKDVAYEGCYVVKKVTPSENNTYFADLYWFSPRVGNYVYVEEWLLSSPTDEEGILVSIMELTKFSYTPARTPGFELLTLLFAAVIIILYMRTRKVNKH